MFPLTIFVFVDLFFFLTGGGVPQSLALLTFNADCRYEEAVEEVLLEADEC